MNRTGQQWTGENILVIGEIALNYRKILAAVIIPRKILKCAREGAILYKTETIN